MKYLTQIIVILVIFAACNTQKEDKIPDDYVSINAVQEIIDNLTPKPYNYEANKVFCVISPDRNYMYLLESEKEGVAEALQAEVIDDYRWNIQFHGESYTTFVTMVNSVAAFSDAFPYLYEGFAVGIPGKCKTGDDCTERVKLDSASCEKISSYSYVKNTFSVSFCECDTSKEGKCFPILTKVGVQYFYGDDYSCSKQIGNGGIWKQICFYD